LNIRYYIDPETEQPHIYGHDVEEREMEESRVAIGRTSIGRYLRVIYVPDPVPKSVYVITAYELRGKPFIAYRRRRRRKKNETK